MENYMEYHIMGTVSQIRMKPGCVPKKFTCQSVSKTRQLNTTEHAYLSRKQRTMIIDEWVKEFEGNTMGVQRLQSVHSRISEPQAASKNSRATPKCDEALNEDLPSIIEGTSAHPEERLGTHVSTSPYIVENDVKLEINYNSGSESHQDIVVPEVRELILRVYRYLQTEYEQLKQFIDSSCELSVLANVLQRTAAATGLTEDFLTLILEEENPDFESDTVSVNYSDVDNDFTLYEDEIKVEPETMGGEIEVDIDTLSPHETADTTLATVKREPADSDAGVTDPLDIPCDSVTHETPDTAQVTVKREPEDTALQKCDSVTHETPDTAHVTVKREPEDTALQNKRRLIVTRVYTTSDVTPAVKSVSRKRKCLAPPD